MGHNRKNFRALLKSIIGNLKSIIGVGLPRTIICSESKTTVTFKFEVLFVAIVTGVLPDDQNHFDKLISSMCPDSGYFMCQGIPQNMSTMMTFQTKSLRSWDLPFQQLDHKDYIMWLKSTSSSPSAKAPPQRCKFCTNLMYHIRREGKKQESVTSEQKAASVQPSSHFPMKYLSPASQEERRSSLSKERKSLKQQVRSNLENANCIIKLISY